MTATPSARVYRGTSRNLARLARCLRAGDLVAVPTETVYGLAGNALNRRTCREIFRAKGRPTNDPLIVHIHSFDQLEQLAETNDAALNLAKAFWPGPLTLVLPKRDIVPDLVSSGLPSVAVRMPAHRLFRRLLKQVDLPLAAPSANPFGYVSPTSAAHVKASLGSKISHILDGGSSSIGVESTIVDMRNPHAPRLLRPGAITREQLERALGTRLIAVERPRRGAQVSPGLLARHYSPRTPATLHRKLTAAAVARAPKNEAWIFLYRPGALTAPNVFWLANRGDLRGAARRLFATLRRVDAKRFAHIHLERAPGGGLADAINDRLTRAAAR